MPRLKRKASFWRLKYLIVYREIGNIRVGVVRGYNFMEFIENLNKLYIKSKFHNGSTTHTLVFPRLPAKTVHSGWVLDGGYPHSD
jgi:hypothetical protein